MLYQLSYASTARHAALRHTYAYFNLPAGTNTELNTTVFRVQATNQLDFQQLCEDRQS